MIVSNFKREKIQVDRSRKSCLSRYPCHSTCNIAECRACAVPYRTTFSLSDVSKPRVTDPILRISDAPSCPHVVDIRHREHVQWIFFCICHTPRAAQDWHVKKWSGSITTLICFKDCLYTDESPARMRTTILCTAVEIGPLTL